VAHRGVQFDRLGRPFVSMTRRLATISFLACCGLEILLTNHILRFDSFGNQTLLCLHACCSNSYGYMRFRDLSMIVLRVSIRFGSVYLVALRLLSLQPLVGICSERRMFGCLFSLFQLLSAHARAHNGRPHRSMASGYAMQAEEKALLLCAYVQAGDAGYTSSILKEKQFSSV
jgi:hypothetical protein